MFTFKVNAPWLQEMMRKLRNPVPLLRAAGRGVFNAVRKNFALLEASRPNKLGGRRVHLYRAMRGSVQAPVVNGRFAVVSINHVAARQRWQGGTIRPMRRRFLTIPAGAEGYGKTAREFQDLRFGVAVNPFGRLQRALGRAPQTTELGGKRVQILRDPVFWLARQAKQKGDPTILPNQAALDAAAREGATEYLAALKARQN